MLLANFDLQVVVGYDLDELSGEAVGYSSLQTAATGPQFGQHRVEHTDSDGGVDRLCIIQTVERSAGCR